MTFLKAVRVGSPSHTCMCACVHTDRNTFIVRIYSYLQTLQQIPFQLLFLQVPMQAESLK